MTWQTGSAIRDLRGELQLTQTQFAALLGVSNVTVSKWEQGHSRPSPHQAHLLDYVRAGQFAELVRHRSGRGTTSAVTRRESPAPSRDPPLPVPLTSFVGREGLLRLVLRSLKAARLVTLTGPGGAGKTRLALETAALYTAQFERDVRLVELADLHDGQLLVRAVADALGVREERGLALLTTLTGRLQAQDLLLILDNCEHLIADCATLLGHLLKTCPRLTVMATSREVLEIAGEMVITVSGLSLPPPDEPTSLPVLLASEAGRLFVDRAGRANPAFEVTERNATAIATICRRLDGLPLAIELATARLSVLTPEEIADLLDDGLRLLTTGPRTAPRRHQTLAAAIDWSYQLLSDEERHALALAGIFRGGFDLAAAEGVWGEDRLTIVDRLDALRRHSLLSIQPVGDTTRYAMLETVRSFARTRLAESPHQELIAARHFSYFQRLAGLLAASLTSQEVTTAWARLRLEEDNFRAALAWALAAGHVSEGLALAVSLSRGWELDGAYSEARTWIARFLDQTSGATVPHGLRAQALATTGSLAYRQSAYEEAESLIRQALHCYDASTDPVAVGRAHSVLGLIAADRGRYEEAVREHRAALEYTRRGSSPSELATALNNLGLAHLYAGELDEAAAALDEALELGQRLRDVKLMCNPLHNLGQLAARRGEPAVARRRLTQSLVLCRQLGYNRGIALSLGNLATLELQQGLVDEATAHVQESLRVFRALGDTRGIGLYLVVRAHAELLRGHPKRAVRWLGAAAALRELVDAPLPQYVRPEYDQGVASLQARLGMPAFRHYFAEGRTLSLDHVTREALEPPADRDLPLGPPPTRTGSRAKSQAPPVAADRAGTPPPREALSPRERDVLCALVAGLSNKEIASRLERSVRTVDHHVSNLYAKLGVSGRAEAVAQALRLGLVDLPEH